MASCDAGRIIFVGNVEAREAVLGAVDVIVCDGYSGNIFLKTLEGTALFLAAEMKKMFKKNLMTKVSALMVSGGIKDFKKLMDSREVGGTPLIGISKPVINAIKNAIGQAAKFASSGMIENIAENVSYMRLPVGKALKEQDGE